MWKKDSVQIQKEVISDLKRENYILSKEIWEGTGYIMRYCGSVTFWYASGSGFVSFSFFKDKKS
jgi:hypothetical protein